MARPKKDYYEIATLYIEKIPAWKRAGRSDYWIAKQMGIGVTTLKKWKNEHKEFARVFSQGREQLIENLESSMFELGLGKVLRKRKYHLDENGEVLDGIVEVEEREVQSETALLKSLAMLKPERWSKRALDGEAMDEKEDKIIFAGEEDL